MQQNKIGERNLSAAEFAEKYCEICKNYDDCTQPCGKYWQKVDKMQVKGV